MLWKEAISERQRLLIILLTSTDFLLVEWIYNLPIHAVLANMNKFKLSNEGRTFFGRLSEMDISGSP